MNSSYKQQLLADFNSRQNYDAGRFYTPIAKSLVEFANLKSGQQILDIATGTGIVAFLAAAIVGDKGQVIGVDISSGMLNNAKQKLEASSLKNIEFIEGDAQSISFDENSFDAILCSLAICYLTNIPAALSQWYKLIKPGGKVVFNTWFENAFTSSVIYREVAAKYGVTVPNPNNLLGTQERCYEILQAVGFESIYITEGQFGWYFNSDTNNAEQMWNANASNVFGYQVQQLSPDKLIECKAEYVKAIQALPTNAQGASWCDAGIFFIVATK